MNLDFADLAIGLSANAINIRVERAGGELRGPDNVVNSACFSRSGPKAEWDEAAGTRGPERHDQLRGISLCVDL
jgi:hypothetical protein